MEDGRMGPFVLFWDRRNIKVDSAKVGDCPPDTNGYLADGKDSAISQTAKPDA